MLPMRSACAHEGRIETGDVEPPTHVAAAPSLRWFSDSYPPSRPTSVAYRTASLRDETPSLR